MNDLLRRIEEVRSSMHQLALQYGFNAPLVLDLSQRLDGLLNTYHESVMKLRHVWVPKGANHEDQQEVNNNAIVTKDRDGEDRWINPR